MLFFYNLWNYKMFNFCSEFKKTENDISEHFTTNSHESNKIWHVWQERR